MTHFLDIIVLLLPAATTTTATAIHGLCLFELYRLLERIYRHKFVCVLWLVFKYKL